jgi:hypothetical protein
MQPLTKIPQSSLLEYDLQRRDDQFRSPATGWPNGSNCGKREGGEDGGSEEKESRWGALY